MGDNTKFVFDSAGKVIDLSTDKSRKYNAVTRKGNFV